MTIFSCIFNFNILAVIVSKIIRGRAFLMISLERARSVTIIHGGLGAQPPVGVQGTEPPVGAQGAKPSEAECLLFSRVLRKLQICPIIDICQSQ